MLSWSTSGIERENANQEFEEFEEFKEFKEFKLWQIARLQAKASASWWNTTIGPSP